MSYAQRERLAMVATMAAAGADAPTLCAGWTVRDLAAHVVIRERRPDAAPGILLSALASYTERVRQREAQRPFEELLELIGTGPPVWSPMYLIDAQVNGPEMFVHHEDVRRARAEWQPRVLPDQDEAALWGALGRVARKTYRRAPVTVVLANSRTGVRMTVRQAPGPEAVLIGAPSELLLHAFGRAQVRLEFAGAQYAIRSVTELDRSV
ncbi:TIGR03085 family metal-binding protein [Skermania piniformis]|uniref:TIGR03085 family protein n=1 Tax=Skermania pinensis TaxID=39122 RepID=A0ABX8S5U3_9ACTN|nr:TIGR03085 family metal-binding protein [Skermania piniformis]QXQ12606.1 TIGR03085 family protein [Skermania piniformis]